MSIVIIFRCFISDKTFYEKDKWQIIKYFEIILNIGQRANTTVGQQCIMPLVRHTLHNTGGNKNSFLGVNIDGHTEYGHVIIL